MLQVIKQLAPQWLKNYIAIFKSMPHTNGKRNAAEQR
jgi:hypothetical protein